MVKVLIKPESALGLSFGVRAQTEMKIWCITGMCILKVSSEKNLGVNCRAQRSGAGLGNRDIAPIARCSLSPKNVKYMSWFWPPGAPCNFGTHDLHLLLGVSKYVSDQARYF